jgi:hypothetical protein
MKDPRFRRENMRNIQKGFQDRITNDAEYAPGAPARGKRTVRRPVAALAATAAVLFTLTLGAFAIGFDPIAAWQGLFEKETSIDVGAQVVSAGISMDVQSMYTDGEHAVVKMTLRDTQGDRLSDSIMIDSKDTSDYFAYVETVSYDAEIGEATCIVKLDFNRQYGEDEILGFAVNSIMTGISNTSEYQPFDFDIYGAAAASDLRPTMTNEEWVVSANANPAPGLRYVKAEHLRGNDATYMGFGGGTYGTLDYDHMLPLDPSAQGEKLCHWLSITGIGYENGVLRVQLKYDDLFGLDYKYVQYLLDTIALVDGERNIAVHGEERRYCGYQEIQFSVGEIENLKELSLAWTDAYAENVVDGNWSFDISLNSVGDHHISGAAELTDHPDYINISYALSSMYLETKVDFPDFSIPTGTWHGEVPGRALLSTTPDLYGADDKLVPGEISIILKDGTRIDLPVDSDNLFDRYNDDQSGETYAKTQHWLDGSFEPEDVAELIIFGVSFTV